MAAIEAPIGRHARRLAAWCRQLRLRLRAAAGGGAGAAQALGLLGGVLAAGSAESADLPEDRADLMYHSYIGGGVVANGPAFLVRKSVDDSLSLNASYYVDMVSNASIDVVTTASPYREQREETGIGLDYVVRDALISVTASNSREPDYIADSAGIDISQDYFGGMTTLNLGYTRGWDTVMKHGDPGFSEAANHWQYRFGVTQLLTARWLMSMNLEAVSDEGYLGSPYRAARLFGAAVPERDPSTRSSRAASIRAVGSIGAGAAVHADFRYFWDTWDIRARTVEIGYSQYAGPKLLIDGYTRYYSQGKALFYSDNFTSDLTYMSRNRQLGSFNDLGLGVKATYSAVRVPARYEIKLTAALERLRFHYGDFTDIRTGQLYSFDATVLELFVSGTF